MQNKILELIEEWRTTICVTSKFKDDLGFIRDMHRLLHYKGYVFPEVKREDAAVLNPTDVGLAAIDWLRSPTDPHRLCDLPTKWKKRNVQHNPQSCKN